MDTSTFIGKRANDAGSRRPFVSFLVMSLMLLLGLPMSASAATGSADCQSATGTQYEFLLKVDPPPRETTTYDITLDSEAETITVKVDEGDFNDEGELVSFDFEASGEFVWAVYVKSGADASQLYEYPEGTDSGTGLTTKDGKGISHISFCGLPLATGDVTLTKDATGDVPQDATTFVFSVDCDDDANAFDATRIELSDGQTVTIADDAPTGTQCTITETDNEGADTTTFTVDDGEPVEADSVTVTVGDDTTVAVLATNDFEEEEAATFSLNLLKVEEGDSSNLLQGARFALYADSGTIGELDEGDSFIKNCTTDTDGECEFDGLDAGDYLLVETRAPSGFVAESDDPIAVSIVGADETVTVENAPVAVGGIVAERPDIALEKIADPVIANVGDTVTYTYLITNTGETTLSDLVLVDDKLGIILLTGVVLEPGDSTSVQETHEVTQADAEAGEIVNVAVVTGQAPDGEEVTARDTAEVAVVAVRGITVTRPDAPQAAPDAEPAPEAEPAQLARTGAHSQWLLLLAIAALLGGTAFLRVADRREEARA